LSEAAGFAMHFEFSLNCSVTFGVFKLDFDFNVTWTDFIAIKHFSWATRAWLSVAALARSPSLCF